MKHLIPLALAGVVGAAACQPEASPDDAATADVQPAAELAPAQDTLDIRQELERVNQEHIDRYNEGDVAGFTEVYTDDARLYPPGQAVVEGRPAIHEFWQGGHDQMGIRDVSLTTDEVERIGDTAWEVGTASYTTNDGPVESRYMVIWKRGPEGEWRWHRDMMSPGAGGG